MLRRQSGYVQVQDEHLKWLWAAYKRGVFSHLPEFPEDMEAAEFKSAVLAVIGNVLKGGGEAWMAMNEDGKPVGFAVGIKCGYTGMEPHLFWFPEATTRNKLEIALKWILEHKAHYRLFLWARPKDWKFFDHMCKYGAIRTVGKYRGFFDESNPPPDDAYLFQGVT